MNYEEYINAVKSDFLYLLLHTTESTFCISVFMMYWIICYNRNKKTRDTRQMAKGLDSIVDKYNFDETAGRISYICKEIEYFYEQYIESRPYLKKIFPNVAVWIDYMIVTINLHKNCDYMNRHITATNAHYVYNNLYHHMDSIVAIQNYIHKSYPYHKTTPYQQCLLSDIQHITDGCSKDNISSIVQKVENEFLRLEKDIERNQKMNRLSITIGVLGIVVSILLSLFFK